MYHVTGTLLAIIILYSLSYFFYINRFFSLQFHRKLWNSVLAAAFLLTALAGLVLALQINYKWEIPFLKSILRWHVEFGIGMAVTGFIHLLWHFSYFWNFFRHQEKPALLLSRTDRSPGDISSNLFAVGFTGTAVQLLLLKEIINITGGYELIAGIFLASWLTGSAAGALAAPRSVLTDMRKINLFFFSGTGLSVALILLFSRIFLKAGETPSFLASVIYTFIVLIPISFTSGFIFIKLVTEASAAKKYVTGKAFSIETTGGIVSGIAVSFFSSVKLNTYQAILLIIVLGYSYAITGFWLKSKRKIQLFKLLVLAVSVLVILSNPDRLFRQFLLRGIKVIGSTDTPYGNITRGEYAGETSIFYDHRLLAYNDDVTEREEDVHYAMLQLTNPGDVLVISGQVEPHIREIIKYPVKKIVYIERDPALIDREKIRSTFISPVISVENSDAYTFVKNTKESFDAVILLLPPPSSLLINRYYSTEFFKNVERTLKPGGVFACSPGINPDYLNKESVYLFSSVYNGLKSVFKNVIPVSGNKLYLIASDAGISTSFCELAAEKGITNIYVGPDYLADDLVTSKSEEVLSVLDKTIRPNSILFPSGCFYYQIYHMSRDLNLQIPSVILLAILFLLPLFSVSRKNMLMYFSSSALSGFEIILLLFLQSVIGNMYQVTGLIIAGLMAGLAAGSGSRIPFFEKQTFLFKAPLLIAYYLLIYLSSGMLINLEGKAAVILILIAAGFIPAFITGNLFREFTGPDKRYREPSSIYGADLAGSAMGFILFSGIAVPFLGIQLSVLLFPVLILAGFLFTFLARKQ